MISLFISTQDIIFMLILSSCCALHCNTCLDNLQWSQNHFEFTFFLGCEQLLAALLACNFVSVVVRWTTRCLCWCAVNDSNLVIFQLLSQLSSNYFQKILQIFSKIINIPLRLFRTLEYVIVIFFSLTYIQDLFFTGL